VSKIYEAVERLVEAEHIGDLNLKSFHRLMTAYDVRQMPRFRSAAISV